MWWWKRFLIVTNDALNFLFSFIQTFKKHMHFPFKTKAFKPILREGGRERGGRRALSLSIYCSRKDISCKMWHRHTQTLIMNINERMRDYYAPEQFVCCSSFCCNFFRSSLFSFHWNSLFCRSNTNTFTHTHTLAFTCTHQIEAKKREKSIFPF